MLFSKQDIKRLQSFWALPVNNIFAHYQKRGKVFNAKSIDKRYIYIDNGGSVLGVAHLDTVINPIGYLFDNKSLKIIGPGLDDRLGAWLLTDIINRHCKIDILLTDNEESGNSTARYFKPPKKKVYNWVVEFDRADEDVVTYGDESEKFLDRLEQAGFTLGFGSFSDIANMDMLNCCKFNLGLGITGSHAINSYADLTIANKQLIKLIDFYEANKNKFYEIDFDLYGFGFGFGSGLKKKQKHKSDYWFDRDYSYLDDEYWDKVPYNDGSCFYCPNCNKKLDKDSLNYQYCFSCNMQILLDEYNV